MPRARYCRARNTWAVDRTIPVSSEPRQKHLELVHFQTSFFAETLTPAYLSHVYLGSYPQNDEEVETIDHLGYEHSEHPSRLKGHFNTQRRDGQHGRAWLGQGLNRDGRPQGVAQVPFVLKMGSNGQTSVTLFTPRGFTGLTSRHLT